MRLFFISMHPDAHTPSPEPEPLAIEAFKRPGRKLPLVRCSPFKWSDKRKGKGYRATGWMVDWQENGKRCRRKFDDQRAAKLFAGQKHARSALCRAINRHVQTRLTNDQLDEAEGLVARLGSRYSLTEVGDFFFRNHQEADFKISLSKPVWPFVERRRA